jgi:hypothetical protein
MNPSVSPILNPATLTQSSRFPITSRYYSTKTAQIELPDGRAVTYLTRRFVPPPEAFALLMEHSVSQGDRLDLISFRYLGDPEAFWRIADANAAVRPDELIERIGRRLRITLPEGIPGNTGA